MKWRLHFVHLNKKEKIILAGVYAGEILLAAMAGVLIVRYWSDFTFRSGICVMAGIMAELAFFAAFGKLLLSYFNNCEIRRLEAMQKEEMRTFLLSQRTQRHDLNIHLMAMLGMIESQRYDACEEYLQELLDTSKALSQLMPLDDPAVSAMLSHAVADAKKDEVAVECLIYDDLSRICCDAYEVNQILGNLIRNAIEAVKSLPKGHRTVLVTLLSRRNHIIFRVENELEEGTKLDNHIFEYGYSAKDGHSGIGLAGVKKVVMAYGGTMFIEQADNKICMIVQLPCAN